MNKVSFLIGILLSVQSMAQDKGYYYAIPDTPSHYSEATVAARLVDGLGFRYYWATEGLTEKDLSYRPSPEARSTYETLLHVEGLTSVLLNSVNKRPTKPSADTAKLSFTALREKTLNNIREASEILKSPDARLEEMNMVFERPGNRTSYPFWNLVNGPVSDALWHVGQVVSFRRSSGNPLPEGVNVLQGRKAD